MAEIEKGEAGSGMSAIVNAMLRNPIAAAQLVAVIVGGIGVYYTLSQDISSVKSDAVNLNASIAQRALLRQKDIDGLTSRVQLVDERVGARYGELNAKIDNTADKLGEKLSTVNSKVDKLDTNIEWIIRQLSTGAPPYPAQFPTSNQNPGIMQDLPARRK